MPPELTGTADEVRVQFPWGSLLRGIVGQDDALVAGLARLLKPGGKLTILVSVLENDRVPGLRRLDEAAATRIAHAPAFARSGLQPLTCRLACDADVTAACSTWAKRLGVGHKRDAWLLSYSRLCSPAVTHGAGLHN